MIAPVPHNTRHTHAKEGMAYLGILLLVLLLTVTALTFVVTVRVSSMAATDRLESVQAGYLAESAANHALWRLLNEAKGVYYVAANRNDSEQASIGEDGEPYGTPLELGMQKFVGLRFVDVAIPQGETVNVARVQFLASDTDAQFTTLTVFGQAIDDAPAFSSAENDLSQRSRTTASVEWSGIQQWDKNTLYDSPDLSPIIQEIVNRPGWVEGNDIVLLFRSNLATGKRRVYAHDKGDRTPAILTVRYGDHHRPMTPTHYTMHGLADGRYGYKVRQPTPTTIATIATVGATGKSAVRQSYVVDIPHKDTAVLVSVDKVAKKQDKEKDVASWDHATANGNDRLLMVCGSVHSNRTMTSVTYDGIPLTHHGTVSSLNNLRQVEMWYLVNPPVGNNDVSVTFSEATDFCLASVSFFGVDPSAPLSSLASGAGDDSWCAVSLPSTEGHLVLDTMVGARDCDPAAPAFGQTLLWSDSGGDEVWGAGSIRDGADTVNMYWDLDSSCKWAAGAVGIRPALP